MMTGMLCKNSILSTLQTNISFLIHRLGIYFNNVYFKKFCFRDLNEMFFTNLLIVVYILFKCYLCTIYFLFLFEVRATLILIIYSTFANSALFISYVTHFRFSHVTFQKPFFSKLPTTKVTFCFLITSMNVCGMCSQAT